MSTQCPSVNKKRIKLFIETKAKMLHNPVFFTIVGMSSGIKIVVE